MLLVGDKVEVDGHTGIVQGRDPISGEYEIKFDKGHPYPTDVWQLPESRLNRVTPTFPTFGEWTFEYNASKPEAIKCDCGAHKLVERDRTPYSHAVWCSKFKREDIE